MDELFPPLYDPWEKKKTNYLFADSQDLKMIYLACAYTTFRAADVFG